MKALVVYKNDTAAYNMACELNDLLQARGLTVETIASESLTDITCPFADLAFVLGGDGTIIHTATSLAGRDIPIAGINLGQVGFLSSIEPNELTTCITKIMSGNYIIQKRSILQASLIRTGEAVNISNALNDIVIKSSVTHPISITIQLNKQFYCRFRGDGLICATPSGSTAYSYSAGGPVIDLALPALVITPICPHMSNFRSVVVSSDSELEFSLDTDYETELYIDGKKKISLQKGDYISIASSGMKASFIKLAPVNNVERIADKRKQLNSKLALNSI